MAAPEAANNAGAQTSFIPMLTLGIPCNPVMALMIGALIIQGITPGPNVVTDEPALFWGLIVSMWVGNLMLVLLNLPLIGMWVKMLTIPYHLLFPAIIAFCCIGAYSVNNNVFDVYAMAMFGLVGWVLIKLDFEPAPLLLGFVLGPMLEENLRRAMIISRGDATVFVTHPLSLPCSWSPPPCSPSSSSPTSAPNARKRSRSRSGIQATIATEANMAIKDLLVHLDETPASTARLQAALALAAACGAQLTALYLIAEPFLPGMGGRHLPAELLREHLAHAEAEAEAVLAAAPAEAERRGTTLAVLRASGPLDRLPQLLARHARCADLTIVGQADLAAHGVDDTALIEAAFMDSGRPALVIPRAGAAVLPPRRAIVAWDGSREAARAANDAIPLLQLAELVLVVDARGAGRPSGCRVRGPPGPARGQGGAASGGGQRRHRRGYCSRRPAARQRISWSWAATATPACAR